MLLLPVATYGVGLDGAVITPGTVMESLSRAGAGYSYDRCDTTNGPSKWSGVCQGQTAGTPVNLCGAIAFPSGAPTIALTGYTTPRTMNISNSGTSVTVTVVSDAPTLTAGTLSTIVGRSTSNSVDTWVLEQMHLHWGRLGLVNEGSEHYKQSTAYAAEAHFVHYNKKYGSFSGAASSGSSDALLVVGVFLNAGSTDDSATITAIANNIATATTTPAPMSTTVTLSDLYNGVGTFYSYGGGLTTPGCVEIVTWIVMDTPKSITTATLNKIWQASTSPGTTGADAISKNGNYRPLTPIGSRKIYNSAGTTASCTAVTEPSWSCPNQGTGTGTGTTTGTGSNAAAVVGPRLAFQAALLLASFVAIFH